MSDGAPGGARRRPSYLGPWCIDIIFVHFALFFIIAGDIFSHFAIVALSAFDIGFIALSFFIPPALPVPIAPEFI